MYPRRLGAGRRGAAPSLRPVNTERAETRRKYETGGTRLSRPMGGRTPTGCGRDKRGPPVCLTCMTIRSFPVPFPSDHFPYSPVGEAARKPTSKPISVSPSLRALRVDRPEATRCTRAASARGAGRRPRASGRSTRSARGHGGNTKREGRACRVRWGGRTPTGCGRDKRGPPAVSFTAYHGWTLPCFFSRSCPSPVAFSSALSGRVSSSRTFRAGSSPCRAALS